MVGLDSLKHKESKWWPEYKCPKCGYNTTVTNVCRRCEVWMCSTGREHRFILGEDGLILLNDDVLNNDGSFKEEWRPITKESEFYDMARSASFNFKITVKIGDAEGPIPEWAWFGEEGKE